MRCFFLFAGLLLAWNTALANEAKALSRPVKTPVVSTSVAPGQSGYVHYFVLEHPDGSLEGHVGIELQDQRIAWSFPDAGVIVSPFIALGPLQIGDKIFKIQHLYGIRPFNDDRSMQTLRNDL